MGPKKREIFAPSVGQHLDIDDFSFSGRWGGGLGLGIGHGFPPGADDLDVGLEIAGELLADERPAGWKEQEKAHRVGEEAGREQDRAGQEDEEAVEDLPVREAALGAGLPETGERAGALGLGEPGTENSRDHDDGKRRPKTDPAAQLHEESKLRNRDQDEEQQEAEKHGLTLAEFRARANRQ